MRILLDAYFDNNFGDDLFIDILLKRYSDVKFYVFWKETLDRVLLRAESIPNLVILPGGCFLQEKFDFDAYVMIGGDVLPDGMNFSERIAGMQHVKACGGFVAMLGFSLYTAYSEKTIEDLRTMTSLADTIVTRDHASAKRLQKLVPEAEITESVDMVIAALQAKAYSKEDVLGVIPRRKLYSTEEQHQAYCQGMAKVVNAYLKKHASARVRFLAFSTGEYDDRAVSQEIMELLEMGNRAEVVAYEGDKESFLEAIGTCNAFVPTRFHGLIFALVFAMPFVPVPYEVKVTQLLDELGYQGIRLPYGEVISDAKVQEAVISLEKVQVLKENQARYESKAEAFFKDMDAWKESQNEKVCKTFLIEQQCYTRVENQQLLLQNQTLKQQQEELEKWIEALKQQKTDLEQQNLEIEEIRKTQVAGLQKQYAEQEELRKSQLEEAQKQYAEQEELRKSQLEEAQKQYAALEELRKSQLEEAQKQYVALEELRKSQLEEAQKQYVALEEICSEQSSEYQKKYEELDALRRCQIEEYQEQCKELDELRLAQDNKLLCQEEELQQLREKQVESIGCIAAKENEAKMLKLQVEELQKWIESLKEERLNFARQNQELEAIRSWQHEKMMENTAFFAEIEADYHYFLQSIGEKLANEDKV